MLLASTDLGGIQAGVDEAGRGCLAGPVVAAAVVLPEGFYHPLLNDSKQINRSTRNQLRSIIEQEALGWAVGICSPEEIDELNILWASVAAMHKALHLLKVPFDSIAVDGNRFKPFKDIPHKTEVKGDARFLHIAAASILAKTHRDEMMEKLHTEFPQYGWNSNAGYPTISHRNAIREWGPCEHHRKSFRLLPDQLTLF
jgi:ribonuclease HII